MATLTLAPCVVLFERYAWAWTWCQRVPRRAERLRLPAVAMRACLAVEPLPFLMRLAWVAVSGGLSRWSSVISSVTWPSGLPPPGVQGAGLRVSLPSVVSVQ